MICIFQGVVQDIGVTVNPGEDSGRGFFNDGIQVFHQGNVISPKVVISIKIEGVRKK
jgi:hypothetical protein